MNRSLAETVVAFLADPISVRADRLTRFKPRQWRNSLHWLVTSGLALHLLQDLKRISRLDALPNGTRATLEQMWSASAARTQSLQQTLLDLNRCFSAAGLTYVNWKGFANIPEFCSDARVRAMSDFDFIVRERDLSAFDSILEGKGFCKVEESTDEVRYENLAEPPITFDRAYHDRPWRKIELHTRMNGSIAGKPMPDYTDLLIRRTAKTLNDIPFPVLSRADAFLLHAMHVSRHFLDGWVRLSWLLEMRHFVASTRTAPELWTEIRSRAENKDGAAILIAIPMWLSGRLFEFDAQRCVGWAFDSMPTRVWTWLKQLGVSATLQEYPGSKLPLLLVRELVDTASWATIANARLMPIKVPPRVARARDTTLRQRSLAMSWQLKYVWMRARFHALGGMKYAIEKRRWDGLMTPPK